MAGRGKVTKAKTQAGTRSVPGWISTQDILLCDHKPRSTKMPFTNAFNKNRLLWSLSELSRNSKSQSSLFFEAL